MLHVLEHDYPNLVAYLGELGVTELPVKTTSVALAAEVNHGRWIVRCPFDRAAQMASDQDHRFYCHACKSEAVGGRWTPVAWPKERRQIEELLMERPEPATRNWLPTETVLDLARENAQRGL